MVSSPNKTTTSSELRPPSTSKFSFTSPIHFNNNKMSPSKSGIPSPNKFNTLPTKSNNPSSTSTSTKLPTASMRSLRPRDRKGRVSTHNHSEPDQEGDDNQNQDHQQHLRTLSGAKGKTRERRKEKESELERGVRPESSLGKRRLPSQEDSDSDLDLNKDIESEIENDWKSEDEWNQNQNQDQMQRGEMLQGEDQDGDQTEGVDQFGRNTRAVVKSNENENVDTPTKARSKMSRLFPGKSTKTNNATRIPPSPSFSSKIRSPQSKVARQGSVMTDVHTSTSTSNTLPRLQKSGIPTSSSTFANPTSSVSSSSRPSPKHIVKSRANTLGWNAGGSKPRSRMSLGGAIPRSSISSNSFNPSAKRIPNERSRTTSNASINSINLDGGEGRNPSRNSLRSDATTTSTLASENQSRVPRRRSSTDNLMNYDPYSGIGLGASENEKGGGHSRRFSSVGSVGGSNIASSMKSQEIPTLEKENKLPIQGGLVIKSGSSLKGPPSTFDSQHRSKPRPSIPGGPPNSFKAPASQSNRKSNNSTPSNSAPGTTPLSKPQQPSSSSSSGNGSVKSRAKAWESSKSNDSKDKVANVRPSNPSLKNPISKIASTTPTSTPSKTTRSNLPNPSPMRTPNSLIGRKVPSSASKPSGLSKLPSSRSLNQLRQDSEKAKQSLPTLPTPDARERGMRRLSGMGFNSNPSSKDSTPKDQDGNGTGGTKSALPGPVANLKNNNTKIKSSSPLKDSFTNNDDHSSPTPIIKIDSSSSHSNDGDENGKGKLIPSPRKSEETRENLEDGLVEMLIKAGLDPSASEQFIHREVEKSRNSLSPSPAPKSSNVSQESSPAANSRRRRNSESIEKIVDGSWSTEQEEEEGGNQKGSDHLKTSHHQEETVGDTSEMNLLSPLSDMESRYNHLDTPDQEFRELEDDEDNLNSPSVDALKRSRSEKAALNHDLGHPKSKSRLNRLRRLQNSSLNFDESFENVEDTSSLGLEMGEDENLMNQSIHFDGRMSTIGSGFLDEEISPRDFKKASSKEDGALKEVDEEQLVEEKNSKILLLESKLEDLQSQSQSENQEKESLALKLKEALHQIEQYKIQSEYDEQARHEISKSQESTVEEMEKLKVESFERIRDLKKEKEKEVSGFKKESCLIKWKEEGRRWKEVERLARIETTMMKNEMDMLVFLKKQAEDWAKMLGEVV